MTIVITEATVRNFFIYNLPPKILDSHCVEPAKIIAHKEIAFKLSLSLKVIIPRAHLLITRKRAVVLPNGSRALSEGDTRRQAILCW